MPFWEEMTAANDSAALDSGTPPPVLSPGGPGQPARRGVARPGVTLAHLFATSGALALGLALVPALATTFRSAYGLSGAEVANLHNLKDAGAILLVLVGPAILHRMGLSAALATSVATGLAGCGAFLLVPGKGGLLLGTFLHGAAYSLGMLTIVTMLFRLPQEYQRISALFATYGIASFLAPAAVALLATPARGHGPVYALYALLLALILVAGVLLAWEQGPDRGDAAGRGAARWLTRAQLRFWAPDLAAYAALMATETIVVAWITFQAQYAYGASVAAASALLSTLWVVHTVVRVGGDVLARRLSPRRVVLWGSLVAICGIVVACLGSMLLAYTGVVIFAVGMAALLPVYQGWVLSRVPGQVHSPMNATLCIVGTLGLTILVWLTGISVDVDTRLPFAASVLLMLLVVLRVARVPRGT